ncbi:DUF1343 domain-containing protein [Ectothiorhodospiraceae bacterium 2226]|nr:DUF1343 domain-containing protein [Ectothiorhodospiraceae bacterium 2226]
MLAAQDFAPLAGKRVGLITNATGVDRALRSTADLLHESPEVELVALFAPEHGVRGDRPAGERIASYTDETTGLPVHSLYGRTRAPTPEMLAGLDVLVYDIQDIGVRSYTYISTLGLAMGAAARAGVAVLVLDRPNPLGGERVEGAPVEPGHETFVGAYPIPYVYGLTVGELAQMMVGEGWLGEDLTVDLEVVPLEGWRRDMDFRATGLPWVMTSPHIPTPESAAFYAATGILGELQVLSEGVGYTAPFRFIGAPWIEPARFAAELNALGLPGVHFRPVHYTPFYGRDQGKALGGVELHLRDPAQAPLMAIQLHALAVHNRLYPQHDAFARAATDRLRMFDHVAGGPRLRAALMEGGNAWQAELERGVATFQERAARYYLY